MKDQIQDPSIMSLSLLYGTTWHSAVFCDNKYTL